MSSSPDTRRQFSILVDRAGGRGPGRGIMLAPAHRVSADTINDMARHGRGLIAACMTLERVYELGLRTMARAVNRPGMPQFLVSVEAVACTETGISAGERALTLRVLGDPASRPHDLHMPGHIMPCLPPGGSEANGLLATATRYARHLSGSPVVAWCDVLDEGGELASAEHCLGLAEHLEVESFHLEVLRQRLGITNAPAARQGRVRGLSLPAMWSETPLAGALGADPMLWGVR